MRTLRATLLALVAAAALPAAAGAQGASCADADLAAGAATVARVEASVLCLTNRERTTRGLPALRQSSLLASVARAHSLFMVTAKLFDHEGIGDGDPAARATSAGYDWGTIAENIASGQATPREVMTSWMKSEGHCRNILSPTVVELGVGEVLGFAGTDFSNGATWTQLFGRPLSEQAPGGSTAPQQGCPYAGIVDAPAAAAPTTGTGTATGTPPTATPAPATTSKPVSAPARRLSGVTAVTRGRTVTVRGKLTPAATGVKVTVRVKKGKRTVAKTVRTKRGGTFSTTLVLPKGSGRGSIEVVAGSARASGRLR